jgi:hypothetical protein
MPSLACSLARRQPGPSDGESRRQRPPGLPFVGCRSTASKPRAAQPLPRSTAMVSTSAACSAWRVTTVRRVTPGWSQATRESRRGTGRRGRCVTVPDEEHRPEWMACSGVVDSSGHEESRQLGEGPKTGRTRGRSRRRFIPARLRRRPPPWRRSLRGPGCPCCRWSPRPRTPPAVRAVSGRGSAGSRRRPG